MRTTGGALLLAAALLVAPATAGAGGRVDDLAFIAGSWSGALFGGEADETWLPPRDGTMAGVFRLTWPGTERRLYELLVIAETADGEVVLDFRHFSPRLEMWEREMAAPLSFLLAESGPRRALFVAPDPAQRPARFGFALNAAGDSLQVTVQSLRADGTVDEEFAAAYARVAP